MRGTATSASPTTRRESTHDRRPRTFRPQPHRLAARRERPHRALQLPVRPAPRRHHGAAHRGHRPQAVDHASTTPASSTTWPGWACRPTRAPTWAVPTVPTARASGPTSTKPRCSSCWPTAWAYPCFCPQELLERAQGAAAGRGADAQVRPHLLPPDRGRGRGPAGRRRAGGHPLPGARGRRHLRRPHPRAHHLLLGRHRRLHHQAHRRRLLLQLRGGGRRRRHGDHRTSSAARTTSPTPPGR